MTSTGSFVTAWLLGLSVLVGPLGCTRKASEAPSRPTAAPQPTQTGPREPHVRFGTKPMELLNEGISAYQVGMVVDNDAVYVLSEKVVFRLSPGMPVQRIPVENGNIAAATRNDIVYYAKDTVWKVAKTGGQPRQVATLKKQPQGFFAADDDFVFLDTPSTDKFRIQTVVDGKVRTLYDHPARIETAVMGAGRVYFVGRDKGDTWRIGSVDVKSGATRFTESKGGVTPARLAFAGDVFYWDRDSNELRRLAVDLSQETVLSRDLICSPLAVGARIYCPNMQGLWELALVPGAKPVSAFPDPRRITLVGVSDRYVAWLADPTAERLSLMVMPLMPD